MARLHQIIMDGIIWGYSSVPRRGIGLHQRWSRPSLGWCIVWSNAGLGRPTTCLACRRIRICGRPICRLGSWLRVLDSCGCEFHCWKSSGLEKRNRKIMKHVWFDVKIEIFFSYNKWYVLSYCVVCIRGEGGTCCNGVMSIPCYDCVVLSSSFEEDEWFLTRNANLLPSRINKQSEKLLGVLFQKLHKTSVKDAEFIHLYTPFLMRMKVHCGLWEGTASMAAWIVLKWPFPDGSTSNTWWILVFLWCFDALWCVAELVDENSEKRATSVKRNNWGEICIFFSVFRLD